MDLSGNIPVRGLHGYVSSRKGGVDLSRFELVKLAQSVVSSRKGGVDLSQFKQTLLVDAVPSPPAREEWI